MRLILLIFSVFLLPLMAQGQFAPQAGQIGSTAIFKDSSIFVAWADSCVIERGWMNIADTLLGKTVLGDDTMALNMADNQVVCLGDGGTATYYFAHPLFDGPGPDFAVFENGFINPIDSNEAYIELAFVEISSDGIHYQRFPSTCLTNTQTQVPGTGVYSDARLIHNLAGKYISCWGVPFDISELKDSAFIDPNNIRYVRVRDVVGSIDTNYGCYDGSGRIINDPYPTDFPTGGFDIDALGIIHQVMPNAVHESALVARSLPFPNPCKTELVLPLHATWKHLQIVNLMGQVVYIEHAESINRITVTNFPEGVYSLRLINKEGNQAHYTFIKH